MNNYFKPTLKNLSRGARIAFCRQFRIKTQDEVSDKLGLNGESKRRSMARYESGDRKPKENRLLEIANILKVNPKIIKEYNF
jgi:transcriptional regulator with XRE-family HTH domain